MMIDPNGEMTEYAEPVQDGDYAVHENGCGSGKSIYGQWSTYDVWSFLYAGYEYIMAAGGGGGNSMVGGPVTGRGNINRLMSIVKMIDLASRSGMLKNGNIVDVIVSLYNGGWDNIGNNDYFFSDQVQNDDAFSSLKDTRIITFNKTLDANNLGRRLGAQLKLVYVGNLSEYDKVEWIQNVTTNSPSEDGGVGKSYIDVGGTGENKRYPFYFPKDVLGIAEQRGVNYGGFWYEDGPGRIVGQYFNRDVYWMAETTLIGYKNGFWHHITTYSWGFSIKQGSQVNITPINQFSSPSIFNQKIINTLNGK